MNKRVTFFIIIFAFFLNAFSQNIGRLPLVTDKKVLSVRTPSDSISVDSTDKDIKPAKSEESSTWHMMKERNILDHLTVGGTLGSTGLGLEVSAPVTRWTNVRIGFEGIPSFHIPLDFHITSYTDGKVSNNFDKIQQLMEKVTDERLEEEVRVIAKPRVMQFKLLVDIFPLQNNRHWHVTAGFYLGGKTIGTAINDKTATSSLVAMNIYNRLYHRLEHFDYQNEPIFGDVYLTKERYDQIMSYGTLGVHIGDYKNGTPYYMTPAMNGTMNARARVNVFRPYLGVGYSGTVDKAKRLSLGCDVGALFWGGAPQVILNDGTNMNKELINVRGKVGDYLKIIKALPVYPVVQFKISYQLF